MDWIIPIGLVFILGRLMHAYGMLKLGPKNSLRAIGAVGCHLLTLWVSRTYDLPLLHRPSLLRGVKRQTFVWDFDSPVEAIWPILADTQRLNEAANFPKHVIEEIVQPDGGVRFVATARLGPYTLIWDDEPQNWVEGQWLRHCRYPRNGPLKSASNSPLRPRRATCWDR